MRETGMTFWPRVMPDSVSVSNAFQALLLALREAHHLLAATPRLADRNLYRPWIARNHMQEDRRRCLRAARSHAPRRQIAGPEDEHHSASGRHRDAVDAERIVPRQVR